MNNNYKQIKSQKLFLLFLITFCLIKSSYSICDSVNCPPLKGVCNGNQCICEDVFITVNNKNIQSKGVNCNYHLKSRFVAFLLEFFFPFGVGHFYSGKTFLALIKLSLFSILICMCCAVLCCVTSKDANPFSIIICSILVLCLISIALMEIFDLVSYAFGLYNDGNGIMMN